MFAVLVFAACNSGTKNASDKADSANKAATDQADSVNKVAVAAADSVNTLRDDASEFLVKSYESGMFEIQLSQLAATNSSNADVKGFASQLVSAHKAMNDQMLKIAMDAHYKLPGGIDGDHAKALDEMGKVKGTDFDKKYMDAMVDGHEKSVKNYNDAADKLPAGATKNYAATTLPKIKEHLAMAKKLKNEIK